MNPDKSLKRYLSLLTDEQKAEIAGRAIDKAIARTQERKAREQAEKLAQKQPQPKK